MTPAPAVAVAGTGMLPQYRAPVVIGCRGLYPSGGHPGPGKERRNDTATIHQEHGRCDTAELHAAGPQDRNTGSHTVHTVDGGSLMSDGGALASALMLCTVGIINMLLMRRYPYCNCDPLFAIDTMYDVILFRIQVCTKSL